MKPGITLAMIVKNDAERLRRCLSSVQGVVAEAVVVDTGSDDDTVRVAEEFGARVLQIEWPDAFDKAVNVALDAVETEWTLRLDSDEWFEKDAADSIPPLVERENIFAYYMVRRDIYDDRSPSEILLLRLWRTDPKIRFVGRVHEHIPTESIIEAAGERFVQAVPVVIQHDGYTGGTLPSKRRRNIALLQQDLLETPGDLFTELCLAEALVADENPRGFEMVQELVDKMLETPSQKQASPLAPWALGLALERTTPDNYFTPRTQSIVRYVMRWHFNSAIALWGLALLESNRGNLHPAYHALRELEEMGETGDFDRLAGTPLVFVKEGAWEFLGNVALALEKIDVARRNFERLLTAHPSHPVASARLKEIAAWR